MENNLLSRKLQNFKYLFEERYESFYLLDLGRTNVKCAFLQIDKSEKKARILQITDVIQVHHGASSAQVGGIEDIVEVIKKSIDQINRNLRPKTNKLIVGLASEMVSGHNLSFLAKRENSKSKIDLRELKNVVHNAELKAYEEIRKRFVHESGYTETDVLLINSTIQEMRIDGYRVKNPIDFDGEELMVSIFNAYLPAFYYKLLEEAAANSKLKLDNVLYEPFMVYNALREKEGEDFEAILIDIGGKTTRVSLARRGRLEEIQTFSFGGESFTNRLAMHFNVGFWEAENIKMRYNTGEISERAHATIEEVLQREFSIFLSALEVILQEFSRASLLPETIILYGGGSRLPIMEAILRKKKWKENLSFMSSPKIQRLTAEDFPSISIESSSASVEENTSLIGMAHALLQQKIQKEHLIQKTLRRIVNLIQE